MFSFGAPANREQFFVFFDIGSASVGACIAVSSKKHTELLWQTRLHFGYTSEADFERYVKTMYATLLEVAMRTSGEGVQKVKLSHPRFKINNADIHCIIGSPWYFGAVEVMEKKAEQPFFVTTEVVDAMLDTGMSTIMESEEHFISWRDVMGESVVLEARPDGVTLEGYPVTHFTKREAKHLSVRAYYAFMSAGVKTHVEDIVQKVFPNHAIHFSTATHLFSHTEYTDSGSSVILEVGEEVTTVSVVKRGSLERTGMCPSGVNHILRTVVPKASNAQDAQKLFGVLIPKVGTEGLEFGELVEPLQKALTEWQNSFFETLHDVTQGVTPPVRVGVVVDEFWYPIFKSALTAGVMVPGIRKAHNPAVFHVRETQKASEAKKQFTDYKLSTVAMLFEAYTRKKGVWYTKEQ